MKLKFKFHELLTDKLDGYQFHPYLECKQHTQIQPPENQIIKSISINLRYDISLINTWSANYHKRKCVRLTTKELIDVSDNPLISCGMLEVTAMDRRWQVKQAYPLNPVKLFQPRYRRETNQKQPEKI
jgi:hypothetical protein